MNIFMVIGVLIQLANGVHVLHLQERVPFTTIGDCVEAMIKINDDQKTTQVAACVQRWPDDRAKVGRPNIHDEVKPLSSGAAGR